MNPPYTVVEIINDPDKTLDQKIAGIIVNMGSAIAVLGISQGIMGLSILAVNPILLGILIASIAVSISLFTANFLAEQGL